MITIVWSIPFVKTITLKKVNFNTYDEMLAFLTHYNYWWERLPFVTRRFYRT